MIQFKKYNFNKHGLTHLNEHDINLLSDLSNSDIDDIQLQTKSVNNKVDGQFSINIRSILNNHQFVNLGLPSGTLWATCNVGAMVRNSFHIGNEIAPYKACFNTALAHTQAVDMTGAEKLFHSVNDLLKGFYKISLFSVTLYKCTIGK